MITPHRQLNLRLCHPDYQRFLDINTRESQRVQQQYSCRLDLPYGKEPLQTLDIFPSALQNSPILVFIHGGYWRALDKKSYRFIAEPFIKNNITVCIINYRLIPSVDMSALLNDVYTAVHWMQKKALDFNGNPNNIILSGHSAGGHLAIMTYLMNEKLRSSIQGICSLSGIFDLSPIKNSYLNDVLNLSEYDVDAFSASNKDLSVLQCPVLLSVGSDETDLFIEESKKLYENHKSKALLTYYEYDQLNHYQIIHQLGKKGNPLVDFILNLAQ